jgi:hypothetical protein
MANDSTDTVRIDIKAIVQGLADVRALVAEIQKLPDAGGRVSALTNQFKAAGTEIRNVKSEIQSLGSTAQTSLTTINTASVQAQAGIAKVRSGVQATSSDFTVLARNVGSFGLAIQQALSGNIFGALRTLSFGFTKTFQFGGGGPGQAIKQIGVEAINTDALVKKLSSTLSIAARDIEGALNQNLLNEFGIVAARALTEPQVALKQLVTGFAAMESAEERAEAATHLFGASAASILPTLEALVAQEQAAAVAADALAAAQEALAVANNEVAAATGEVTAAEEALEAAYAKERVTVAELAALESDLRAADLALAEAQLAAADAANALAIAQGEVAAASTTAAESETEAAAASTIGATAMTAMTVAAGGLLVVLGLIVGIGIAVAKSFADAADKVYELSQKSGLSASNVSTLAFAAKEAGSTIDKSLPAFDRYIKNVNEAAAGNKALAYSFNQLGIDTKSAAESSDNALQQLFTTINKLPPGAQQVDAAMKLAGRSGADLIPIIKEANGNFDAFKEKAEALGVVISDQDAKAAHDFKVSMDDLEGSLIGIRNEIGSQLLPQLTVLATNLTNLLTSTPKETSNVGNDIGEIIKYVLAFIFGLIGTIQTLGIEIGALIEVVIGLFQALYDVSTGVFKLGEAIGKFIAGDLKGAMDSFKDAAHQAGVAVDDFAHQWNRAIASLQTPASGFEAMFALFSNPATNPVTKTRPQAAFKGGAPSKTKDTADQLAKAQEELEKAQLAASTQAQRDALKDQENDLKRHYELNEVTAAKYYKDLEALQLADIDVQLTQQKKLLEIEQKRLDTTKGEPARLRVQTEIANTNAKIAQLENQRGEAAKNASFESQKAAEAYLKTLRDVDAQILTLQGHTLQAAEQRIDDQFKDQLKQAQARAKETGSDTDVKRLQTLINLLKLQAQYNDLQKQEKVIEEQRSELSEKLNTAVAQGLKTRVQADKELEQFENSAAASAGALIDRMDAVAKSIGDPALQAAVEKVRIGLANWKIEGTARDVATLQKNIETLGAQREIDEQKITQAVKDGQLNDSEAHDLRMQHVKEYTAAVSVLLDQLEAIAKATHNTDLQQYVDKARGSLKDLGTTSDNVAKSLNEGFVSTIGNLFGELSDGAHSAKQAFLDFGAGVFKVFNDVLAKIILTKIAMAAFGGSAGKGGIGGFLSGLFGGGGGFATGGLFRGRNGVDNNLVPVSDGEYIVNAESTSKNLALLHSINANVGTPRNLNVGGGISGGPTTSRGSVTHTKIINVLPTDLLENYITSGDGRQALLNFIESNPGAINTRLNQAA